ncbi:MAG: alpha/beta hydrolase [Planctomycetota bacterium]|nr:MAG: alpha/beta hydrolase [Planctomycetota bacterium]
MFSGFAFGLFTDFTIIMSVERMILIPGMGADERLYGPQGDYGLDFEVLRPPVPDPDEDMAGYAGRVGEQIGLTEGCVVGGVSFGGMLACELARHCRVRGVILIASCSDGSTIPKYYHFAELVSRAIPDFLIRRRCIASSRMLAKLESLSDRQYQLIRDMSREVPIPFLRRASKMLLNWNNPPPILSPVYHIHGAKDRIIPIRNLSPDEIIPDGGHLINLTHARIVNKFIERHLC